MRVEQEPRRTATAELAAHELRELVRVLRRAAVDEGRCAGGAQHDDVAAHARDERSDRRAARLRRARRSIRSAPPRRAAAPPPTRAAAVAPSAVRQELPPVRHRARHTSILNEWRYSAARAAAERSAAVIVSRYVSAEPRFTIIIGRVARDRVHVILRVAQLDARCAGPARGSRTARRGRPTGPRHVKASSSQPAASIAASCSSAASKSALRTYSSTSARSRRRCSRRHGRPLASLRSA